MGIVNIIVPVQHLLLICHCYSEIEVAEYLNWHILEKEILDVSSQQIFKSDLTVICLVGALTTRILFLIFQKDC